MGAVAAAAPARARRWPRGHGEAVGSQRRSVIRSVVVRAIFRAGDISRVGKDGISGRLGKPKGEARPAGGRFGRGGGHLASAGPGCSVRGSGADTTDETETLHFHAFLREQPSDAEA